ncbi:MAG TPA: hypothetical protein VJP77_00640 [Planctomycetota bacterium]|nr:hypothetical protein [Planctomycetota bacterium]
MRSGLRRCTLKHVNPVKLPGKSGFFVGQGLAMTPVALESAESGSYSNAAGKPRTGEPFQLRVAIGRPEDTAEFHVAWARKDDLRVGELLGYPDCCRRFFQRTWVERGIRDTTWHMATAGRRAGGESESRAVEVSGPLHANILLRWIGVRFVPHLPCSAACEASADLGRSFEALGRTLEYGIELDWMSELLSWPVQWRAKDGVATIRTPILTITASTDVTPEPREVWRVPARVEGVEWPARPTGSQARARPQLEPSRGPAEAAANPWYAKDNGFASREVMDASHAPIVELAAAALRDRPGNILDLGCGNGALLRKIVDRVPRSIPFGIDCEVSRAAHAAHLLPEFEHNFFVGDLVESAEPWPPGRKYRLALLMPGRLLEAGGLRAAELRRRLEERCDQILLYAYGDWLERAGGLPKLAADAGFTLADPAPEASAALASGPSQAVLAAGGLGGASP